MIEKISTLETKLNICRIPYSGMRWHFEVKKRIEKISQNVIYLSARSLIVPSLTKVSTVLVVHDLIARAISRFIENKIGNVG